MVPDFTANGTVQNQAGDASVGWPAHQARDRALLVGQASGNDAFQSTPPTGFTSIVEVGVGSGAGSARLAIWERTAQSGAEAAVTVTDQGDHQSTHITTFRGVYLGGSAVLAGTQTGTGTTVTFPGGQTFAADALVVMIVAHGIDANGAVLSAEANGALGSVTEIFDNGTNLNNGGGIAMWTGTKATAGTFGTGTATLSSSASWVAATIVLNSLALPAGDGVGPVVANLTPASPGDLQWNGAVDFDYQDADGVQENAVVISVWFEGEAEPTILYDLSTFRGRWGAGSGSTASGPATNRHYKIKPIGGWRKNITRLRIGGTDIYGAQGA